MEKDVSSVHNEINASNREWCVISAAIVTVVSIWLVAALTIYFINNFDKTGQYGDGFGGVTALFSGLAFAGIIATLYLQRGDLQLQREMLKKQYEELKNTNKELSGQREQMKLQNDFINKQNFESTFFN